MSDYILNSVGPTRKGVLYMCGMTVSNRVYVGTRRLPVGCIGEANIWLEEDFCLRTVYLAQEIIIKALDGTSAGDLEVIIFDYNLRGISAPFAALRDRGLLRTLLTESELTDYISLLKQHIQGVRDVIQGRESSLFEFRATVGKPIEGYKLVVLAVDMYLLEDRTKQDLALLLKAGPSAGVTFMIISPSDDEFDFLSYACVSIDPRILQPVVKPDAVIAACGEILRRLDARTGDPIPFADIEDLSHRWQGDSTDGVTFSVGKFGMDTLCVTIGSNRDQRHNALITGAVGQGKSNLLAVIIHSLCQRYSPAELELYLLDFKEGVTLQNYSNIDHEDYLPHVRALGLEADVDFGIAVLRYLHDVYAQRMQCFKHAGVQNLKQYRENTGNIVPRIVVIIDEFQIMLEDRATARTVVDLLSRSVRLYRAAGIHFILASQTIAHGITLSKDSDIFAQTPIRMAHKNSVRESEATLGLGNIAAADLKTGEAIINLDYGAIASNRKVQIAWADDTVLSALRREWWRQARSLGISTKAPSVFDGNRTISLGDALPELKALRGKEDLELLLGKTISVDGKSLKVDFSNEVGRNLIVLGAGENRLYRGPNESRNAAIGVLESAMISLAYGSVRGNAQFVICDLCDKETSKINNVRETLQLLETMGCGTECLSTDKFTQRVNELYEGLADRSPDDGIVYLIFLCMEKMRVVPQVYEKLMREGPARGVHFLVWWQKGGTYDSMDGIGRGAREYFDLKVLLHVDEKSAQHILGIFAKWVPRENRALVDDATYLSDPVTIVPYMPLGACSCSAIISSMT